MDQQCFEKIGLFFSARGLPKLDTLSHTDAFVVVNIMDPKTKTLRRLEHTSVIKDSENPDWPDQVAVDYRFEENQVLVFQLYDQDSNTNTFTDLKKHDFIGEITFSLAKLMCAGGQRITANLTGGHHRGELTVRGEALTNTRDVFVATFSAQKLTNKDGMFGKSDPFLVIHRGCEDGSFVKVFSNTRIDNNLSPVWPAVHIPLTSLCNGDIDRPLKIEIYDYDSDGKHDFMGCVKTSVRGLLDTQGTPANVIEEEKQKKSKGYINSGTLIASQVVIEKHPTLQEYLMGGCEITMTVAIDFTGSNGDPALPSSLHYIDRTGNELNQYQQAILSVGGVLNEYDRDHMYPVYGFGSKVRTVNGEWSPVQHCFPVYGGGVEVQGVEGILKAYMDCIPNVALSGPTVLAPIIRAATEKAAAAKCRQDAQKYQVLVILTDGVINDADEAIAAIVEASFHPMSIIIIGVGSADFSEMRVLDGDGGPLKVRGGKTAVRDIVQFVSFQETMAKGSMELAQEVLKEIPTQLLSYMAGKNITPNAPRPLV